MGMSQGTMPPPGMGMPNPGMGGFGMPGAMVNGMPGQMGQLGPMGPMGMSMGMQNPMMSQMGMMPGMGMGMSPSMLPGGYGNPMNESQAGPVSTEPPSFSPLPLSFSLPVGLEDDGRL